MEEEFQKLRSEYLCLTRRKDEIHHQLFLISEIKKYKEMIEKIKAEIDELEKELPKK